MSLLGWWRIFGEAATYTVCVNTIPASEAARKVGNVPQVVVWKQVTSDDLPKCIRECIGAEMAEGMAWKLAPARINPHRHELVLYNDVILWRIPDALRDWIANDRSALLAEDVRCAFGRFGDEIQEPRNCGIVGLPPSFDYERAFEAVLARRAVRLSSELDEPGLQAATLARSRPCLVVSTEDVSICSPFAPGTRALGPLRRSFRRPQHTSYSVGLFRPAADEWSDEHREQSRPMLERLVSGGACGALPEDYSARQVLSDLPAKPGSRRPTDLA